jgi:predicted ferric reductase
MSRARAFLVWAALGVVLSIPMVFAITSPLLAWREPVYIVAGFAGVVGLALLLLQPLLVGGYLPGLAALTGRRAHRVVGVILVVTVVAHVVGLWITSPPDVVDALLFASPTPFSVWGVIAMWAIFAAALLGVMRRRLRRHLRVWRIAHTALAIVIVGGTVTHAVLIEGTMETLSKVALCALVIAALVRVVMDLRVWAIRPLSR